MKKQNKRPLNKALDLLSQRSYSEKRLRQKLVEKEFDSDEIDEAITKLKELEFINDLAFAKRLVEEYKSFKNFGKKRIYIELIKKGFDKNTIDDALQDEDDYREQALESFNKYIRTHKRQTSDKFYRGAISYLVRQGHEYNLSRDLVLSYLKNGSS